MSSPYSRLPERSFWKTGVASHTVKTVPDLYRKKFEIRQQDRIATAGSCFAQHIARNLRKRGYNVLDAEVAPPRFDEETAQRYGFQLYSARYGNIYVVRQLLQLTREALGEWSPGPYVWTKDGRYYDALRPSVEPSGLPSAEAVAKHRQFHLSRVRTLLKEADIFIFTLGLTETWLHQASGTVYPTAPGTIAGTFDPAQHVFKNFTYPEILEDFKAFRTLIKSVNPGVRFLLTVSPVPLTATASPDHVLCATTYSKSTLRAVAGDLCNTYDDVDYFPSYELIATPFARNEMYEENLRSVRPEAVEAVMRIFFGEHRAEGKAAEASGDAPAVAAATATATETASGGQRRQRAKRRNRDPVCEEILLDSFAR